MSYIAPKLWSIVHETMKKIKFLESFKLKNGKLNDHVSYVQPI